MSEWESVKQIPVFSGEGDKKNVIGFAEIKHDGSIAIGIQPGMLEKNTDLRVIEQIQGFFVSYEYVLPTSKKLAGMEVFEDISKIRDLNKGRYGIGGLNNLETS